jgi:hypothetical protein
MNPVMSRGQGDATMTKLVLDDIRLAARARKRCAVTWRRRFLTEAVVRGLTRDLDLTWDGGREFPNSLAGIHVAEFHARGKIVRETVTEHAVIDFWRADAESLNAIRRAVEELLSDDLQSREET